jgi:hypothetical protein
MQPDQRPQPFFGAFDASCDVDHTLFGNVHGVRHDVVEDLVLRLEVVVEAALRELERGGDVVHGGGVVALLLEQAGGSAQNFLAGFNGSFAEHHLRWYRGMGFGLYLRNPAGPMSLPNLRRHRVQKFHVGAHGSIHALHFRIRGFDQVVLIRRVGAFPVP